VAHLSDDGIPPVLDVVVGAQGHVLLRDLGPPAARRERGRGDEPLKGAMQILSKRYG